MTLMEAVTQAIGRLQATGQMPITDRIVDVESAQKGKHIVVNVIMRDGPPVKLEFTLP